MLQTSTGETVKLRMAASVQSLRSRQGQTRVAVILEVSQPPQNGQELILQFVKIPLDRTQSWEVRE